MSRGDKGELWEPELWMSYFEQHFVMLGCAGETIAALYTGMTLLWPIDSISKDTNDLL